MSRSVLLMLGFSLLHLALWTAAPAVVHRNLPLDVIEQLAWGAELQFGYFKHPPLAAWLTEATARLAAGQGIAGDWPFYLLAQLVVVAAFWAVFFFAADVVGRTRALLSVLLLELVVYYSFLSTEFNANTVLFPVWALAILALWRAVRHASLGWWVVLGLAAAAGLLGKYTMGLLLAAMAVWLVADPAARPAWRTAGPYVALAVALAAAAPHLVWLVQHDFPTFAYALSRAEAGAEPAAMRHGWYPAKFLLGQAMLVVPAAVLCLLLGRRRRAPAAGSAAAGRYIAAMLIGPFAIACGVSAALGAELRSMWGAPMLLLAGVALVHWLGAPGEAARYGRFARLWAAALAVLVVGYLIKVDFGPWAEGRTQRVHYPGAALATAITAAWDARFDRPLTIVVGDVWPAGNVAWYAPGRPTVYSFADPARAPWIDDAAVRDRGAVLVWTRGSRGEQPMPLAEAGFGDVDARFGMVEEQPGLVLDWQSWADHPPLHVGWAIVPPGAAAHGD